jgi:hypothetical protein
MAASSVYVGTPKTWHQVLATANANRDGTGTLEDLVSGGSIGSRVDRVRVQARGATTAGVIRLFMQDNSANKRLIREKLVEAITPSTLIEAWSGEITFPDGLPIPNGWTLRVSTHNAESFNAFAFGGDF